MSLAKTGVSQKQPTWSPTDSWPESLLNWGEMGQRIYQFDWAGNPLGPLEGWSPSLRAAVEMILPNSFGMCVMWGEKDIELYNDAFISIAGHNHPAMLGNYCSTTWAEIWNSILGPVFQDVRRTGKAILSPSQHFPVLRFGYLEEVYCMIAYSPLRDVDGENKGILITITETTAQVLGERRMKTLRDLGARSSEARSIKEACDIATCTFAREESANDIPFSLIYLLDDSGETARLTASSGIHDAHVACIPKISINDNLTPWPLATGLDQAGILLDDIPAHFGSMPGGPWPESPRSALVCPIASPTGDRPIGFLIAGISPRREFDAHYHEFLTLVTAQVSTAISNATAYEQERQRAEKLAELDEAKTTFFSNVSHEFRTPLTLILGPLEELLNHPGALQEETRSQLETVHRNGLRLLRLVNSLLDFSRIEANRVQATYRPTDLASFTAELASVFRSTVEKAGLELNITCAKLPEQVYVDRDMWEKITLNLISNAFKFTFSGSITVQLTHEEGQAILRVKDTGTGISETELPQIFERFHRVKGAQSRSYEGSGIGLSLVRELARLHGGSVEAESISGTGSIFTVSIPMGYHHLPADRIAQGSSHETTPTNTNAFVEEALRWLPDLSEQQEVIDSTQALEDGKPRPTLLLADDNTDMLMYVKRLLMPYYDVIAVPNGQEALTVLKDTLPDMIITDVMMPQIDGFALLNEIRKNPRTQTLPVIMLSARAGEEANIEGLDAGADDYLVKPFSAKELLARVRANLEMARIRNDAEETVLQAQKMQVIGQLAGGVAHDFNSLLTVLMGNLKLLENHIADPTGQRMLNAALKASERTGELTRQLLAFARKQQLERTTLDLNTLVQELEDMLKRTLGGQITVEIQLATPPSVTIADARQMELALLNLAINARDAMPSGGTLTVQTEHRYYPDQGGELQAGDYVVLSVRDTGHGMGKETLARVFEPFFTTKDVGQGTGLGLSQVHGLAKQLGGSVHIQSTPGQGTTVEIWLPKAVYSV